MRVAIIYSTKHGTTSKISATLAQLIGNRVQLGLYDVSEVANVNVLEYDTIILGTSIYGGHPLQSMTDFCIQYEDKLKQRRLFLFVCGKDKDKAQLEIESAYPTSLLSHSEESRFIEGEFLLDRMKLWERLLLRWCFKIKASERMDYYSIVKDYADKIAET